MDINKNKYILISLCMLLLTGCGSMAYPQENEGLEKEDNLQQNEEVVEDANLQQYEELSEWEKLYDQWQEKELETKLSFGKEIYSVSVVRRCIKTSYERGTHHYKLSYLFPYKDKGDVCMSFAGELAYEDWKELMEIVNKSIAEKPFNEINILP